MKTPPPQCERLSHHQSKFRAMVYASRVFDPAYKNMGGDEGWARYLGVQVSTLERWKKRGKIVKALAEAARRYAVERKPGMVVRAVDKVDALISSPDDAVAARVSTRILEDAGVLAPRLGALGAGGNLLISQGAGGVVILPAVRPVDDMVRGADVVEVPLVEGADRHLLDGGG